MQRSLQFIVILLLAWLVGGCAVQVRQLDTSKILPGEHKIVVHSTSAQLAHDVAKTLRDANFQITANGYDWYVNLSDENIYLDELTPDITGAITFRIKHYSVKYSFHPKGDKAARKSGTIYLSEHETATGMNDLQTLTRDEAQSARFRVRAAYRLAEILIDHISSVDAKAQ